MTLGLFITVLIAGVVSIYFCMALIAFSPRSSSDFERRYISTFLLLTFGIALMFRADGFGVDTITYLRFYDQFCFSNIDDLDLSYQLSFGIINVAQFGTCNSEWLKATWVILILLCFALLPGTWADRLKIGALGLFSFIGTELSTNALRQGLSAAVLMLAFAWYFRNRIAGLSLAIFAALLHFSSILVIVAVAISFLNVRNFLIAFSVLIILVLSYSYVGLDIELLNRLTYEIYKYSLHESNEFYIRVLAAAQLLVPILVWVATSGWAKRVDNGDKGNLAMAVKLALTAMPYLTLPYFGYRYIYGIYLIVLFSCRSAVLDDRRPAFEMVLIANALIALAWAFGSSFVSQMPFLHF